MDFKPITGRKIRIALVGCAGRVAKNHLDAIMQNDADLELYAVCDAQIDKSKEIAAKTGAKHYDLFYDLLNDPNIDVITLCTPSGVHALQTVKAAEAGKHVITEKPMATRWNAGLEMVRACDEANVKLFVVKQNRFNSTLQLLKQATDLKRFGRVYLVNVNVFWMRAQSYYDLADWRGTWEFDGGAFMNQASHYIDLLHWLIGPVQTIHAMTATLGRNIEAEDTGVLNVRWRCGALGSMNVTNLTYPKDLEGSITILGEHGTVKVGGVALNKIEQWTFKDKHPDDEKIHEVSYETDSVYGFGHTYYYKNVIDVLRGTAEALTDGRSGLKSLELLIAAYLSAREGRPVHLPLEY